MQVVTASEMRMLEKETMAELGLTELLLMENAGAEIVRVLETRFGNLRDKRVHILVGGGNNGGDGLVVARHLLAKNARPKVYLVGDQTKFTQANRTNLAILKKLNGNITTITEQSLPKLKFSLSLADMVVDALLGTGLEGPLRKDLAVIVDTVNEVNRPVAAVDVPTGVNSTTGAVENTAVRADLTIGLGLLKVGCLVYPGREYVGDYEVVSLGVPLMGVQDIKRFLLDESCLKRLPDRPDWGHKGTFGHTLVVAGSRSMAGAAALCGKAVLRGGGGLVTLAIPQSIASRFSPDEVIVAPIPDTDEGTFGKQSVSPLKELYTGKDVLVIGPGLSQDSEVQTVVEQLLMAWSGPAVIDADGLNVLTLDFLERISPSKRKQWVFTPHPGEMGRLIGKSAQHINENRLQTAWEFGEKWKVTLVLKGAPTVISGQGKLYINSTGNHGMGTGGMGDVLTGLIGALLSQGMSPVEAGAVGAYVHGLAGDYVGQQGKRGLTATDCLQAIQRILQ